MEKKTTHRIIGILVVIALIIILLPLLFDGSSSTQTAEVKAPPFPDQEANSVTTALSTSAAPSATAATVATPNTVAASFAEPGSTPPSASSASSSEPVATPAAATASTPAASAEPTSSTSASSTVAEPIAMHLASPAMAEPAHAAASPPVAATTNNAALTATDNAVTATGASEITPQTPVPDPVVTSKVKAEEPTIVAKTSVAKPVIQKAATANVKTATLGQVQPYLSKLKHAAWAVQMGSFKNKDNALRLANQLRSKGFKAFTTELKDSTRVYVGPEFKQASAATLADKIQHAMSMQGIVVSYHPLEI